MKPISRNFSIAVAGLALSLTAYAQDTTDTSTSTTPSTSATDSMTTDTMTTDTSMITRNSETVKQVQEQLKQKGHDVGPVDGMWGNKSASALKKFQEDQGMEATGQLDQKTMAALGVSGSMSGTPSEGTTGAGAPGTTGSTSDTTSQGRSPTTTTPADEIEPMSPDTEAQGRDSMPTDDDSSINQPDTTEDSTAE